MSDDLAERIDKAKFAVAKARLQLARLLDYAGRHGLSDESSLAASTFEAIKALDDSFPYETDTGTGLPLSPEGNS